MPGRVPISAATLVSSSCLSAPPALNRPLSVPQRTCTDTSSLPTRSPRHAAIAARPHEFTVSCVPRSRIYTRIRFCLKALEKLAKVMQRLQRCGQRHSGACTVNRCLHWCEKAALSPRAPASALRQTQRSTSFASSSCSLLVRRAWFVVSQRGTCSKRF